MKTQRGFTLIEIIIALFIFAIVAVIISYGLNSIMNSKAKIKKRQQQLDQLAYAMVLMQHDFSQLIDYQDSDTGGLASTQGNNRHITFTATSNANPMGIEKRSNLLRVNYHVNHNQLIRTVWFNLNSSDKNTQQSSRVLLSNISQFKLRYYTTSGFVDTWPPAQFSVTTPPLAVQVTFNISNQGQISQLYRIRGNTIELE